MDRLLEIAMLKLVLRTKREPNVAFDSLVHDVCENMQVDELSFKRYLAQHMPQFVKAEALVR